MFSIDPPPLAWQKIREGEFKHLCPLCGVCGGPLFFFLMLAIHFFSAFCVSFVLIPSDTRDDPLVTAGPAVRFYACLAICVVTERSFNNLLMPTLCRHLIVKPRVAESHFHSSRWYSYCMLHERSGDCKEGLFESLKQFWYLTWI